MCAQLAQIQAIPEVAVPPISPPVAPPVSIQTSETIQHVMLHGVSWHTYESLLSEHNEKSGTHFAYHKGTLEIMVLSPKHESLKQTLSYVVDVLAEELDIDIQDLGSTTFRREDLSSGFEPDSCFYIQSAAEIRGKSEIDLTVDPSPELIIEIDLTSFSLDKFPIFAALGVQEVWRYDGESVLIYTLSGGEYVEQPSSTLLEPVTAAALTDFVASGQQLTRPQWLRQVRDWIQNRLEK
ncbi:MAG: Uma2 family endonuclease [Chloroflexota bacterium]